MRCNAGSLWRAVLTERGATVCIAILLRSLGLPIAPACADRSCGQAKLGASNDSTGVRCVSRECLTGVSQRRTFKANPLNRCHNIETNAKITPGFGGQRLKGFWRWTNASIIRLVPGWFYCQGPSLPLTNPSLLFAVLGKTKRDGIRLY